MKYTVSKSIVRLIGGIWMPMGATCAMEKVLGEYDLGNIEKPITRETVEAWLMCNSGDFSSVKDFYASLEVDDETVEIEWADEESEGIYWDCMEPGE